MSFLVAPQEYTPSEFKAYVASIHWTAWRPKFIVLHNTAEPNLSQWAFENDGVAHERQRIVNLNAYYRSKGWHSGPHLFISPGYIWDACDLRADGVHASCYNSESIGVEMVGDYATDAFSSGDGAKVRDLTVLALAILHEAIGIDPATLRFHKECLADHHDCPGRNVDKADMIARVAQQCSKGSAPAAALPAAAPSPIAHHVEAIAMTQPQPQSYDERAATIYKYWIAAGFTPAQACGLLAQADAESSLDPNAVGDHGSAFGLDQWHGDRADAIKAGCGVNLRAKPPLADQLKAALWELTHTEKTAFTHIKAQATAYDAGFVACRLWERPASMTQWAKRGATAQKWANYFLKNPV